MAYALFEDVLNPESDKSYLFTDSCTEICIYDYSKVDDGLFEIDELSKRGYYLAGYIAYDSILGLEPRLKIDKQKSSDFPLIHFHAYRKCKVFPSKILFEVLQECGIEYRKEELNLKQIILENSFNEYQKKFDQIQTNLIAGNTYQVNLTLRGEMNLESNSLFSAYYHFSRNKPVEYAALLPYLPNALLSFSPELFFQKSNDEIRVKPMKGTAPRGNNPISDDLSRNWLSNDAKNQAENLIIVDLLRNDLSRFCQTGTIKVNELFKVETYATVFQMVSEIKAKVDPDISFSQIIHGLFPCGSITGAPKISTMQIIDSVESSSRQSYCGTVGFILPNNDMHFNVAIRTLNKNKDSSYYKFGVGGGITIQSEVTDEWEEIKTKLKFITDFYQPDFELIESMLVVNGNIKNLSEHLSRLVHSASSLMFRIDIEQIKRTLIEYLTINLLAPDKKYKLRLTFNYSQHIAIAHSEITETRDIIKVALLNEKINTQNQLFQHKTTAKEVRGIYDLIYEKYITKLDVNELIFINQDGVITESRYFNVIIEDNGQLITSPVREGLLPGVFRQIMIENGELVEKSITPEMLENSTVVYLCNDVRGLLVCEYKGRI